MGCARYEGDLQVILRSRWNQDAQWVVKKPKFPRKSGAEKAREPWLRSKQEVTEWRQAGGNAPVSPR